MRLVLRTFVSLAGLAALVAAVGLSAQPAPPHTLYFAEGATGGFDTVITVVNPSDAISATVTVEAHTDLGETFSDVLTVGPLGRAEVSLTSLLGGLSRGVSTVLSSDVAVVAERRMRWLGTGSASTLERAIDAPATTWYFAEGHLGPPFSLFYLFYNPGDTPATVQVHWRPADGAPATTTVQVAPRHRYTLWADLAVPPSLQGAVAAVVTSDRPIVAERAVYLIDAAGHLVAGTAAAGAPDARADWYFAEGSTEPFFDQFLLLLNPSASAFVEAQVDFHLADGSVVSRAFDVPASRRKTIWLNAEATLDATLAGLAIGPVAMRVRAAAPDGVSDTTPLLVAERAMWGPRTPLGAGGWYQAHASGGVADPSTGWMIPGAAAGGPLAEQTYALLWNPSSSAAATVTLDPITGSGGTGTGAQVLAIPPGERVTVELGALFDLIGEFSVRVRSDLPLIVEYARYDTQPGRPLATGAAAAAVPLAPPPAPCDPIVVTPVGVPPAVVTVAYTPVVFMQSGGEAPIMWSLAGGSLPPGLTFDPATGTLGGTPLAPGSFPLTVTATDVNACSGNVTFALDVQCASITLSPASMPDGRVGVAYQQTVTAVGGGPFTFAMSAGTLPAGLTLAADGTLAGTPTSAGPAAFSIAATGTGGCTGTAMYAFTVEPETNELPVLTVDPISYATAGNTQLHVAGATLPGVAALADATSILARAQPSDVDGPGPLAVVPVASGTSAEGGTFTLHADGGFTYVPPPGYTGTDSFTYTVTDGHPTVPGTVTGTVQVVVSEMVWYVRDVVDADNPAGGDGRSTDAFESLAAVQAAAGEGHTIFVFAGNTATTPLDGGITLRNGQRLLGEAVGLQIPTHGSLVPAGARPVITNTASGGIGVTVWASSATGDRQGVEIRGLSIGGDMNAVNATSADAASLGITIGQNVAMSASGAGIVVTAGSTSVTQTLGLQQNVVSAGGTGIAVTRTSGLLTIVGFSDNAITGATSGSGIVVSGPGIVFDALPGGLLDPVAGGSLVIGEESDAVGLSGLVLSSVSGALTFSSLSVHAGAGTGLLMSGTGPWTGAAGTLLSHPVAGTSRVRAVGGPAIDLSMASTDVHLASISSTNSATHGVRLADLAGAPASVVSVAAGAIASASGDAFLVSGGSANISYGGTIANSASRSVVAQSRTGGALTFTGAITDTGTGVLVSGNTGGTTTFAGGLALTTSVNPAFTATNGGTLNVCDENPCAVGTGALANTLSTTTGTALSVTNTTIGTSGLEFRSISANGAASGIVLNGTGTSGGLIVSGSGGTCSSAATCTGGAIQNTTSHGISLTATSVPSFNRVYIASTGGHGVGGTQVNGFTFTNGVITSSGTDAAVNRANIGFNVATAGTERNVSGAVTITGSTLTNSRYHGIHVVNFDGTISQLTITNNLVTSTTDVGTSLGSGISVFAQGSAGTAANVTRAEISGNQVRNFPSGSGIVAWGGNEAAAGPSGVFGTPGSGTDAIVITGNRISGASPTVRMGGEAITAWVQGRGQGNFVVSNNGAVGDPLTNVSGIGISSFAVGQVTMTSTISNNLVVPNNVFGNPGINAGASFRFTVADQPSLDVAVTGNTISGSDGNGILVFARDSNGLVHARVQNNSVAAPLGGVRPGIRVDSGNGGAGENDTVCLNISGNVSAGSGGAQGIGLRKQGTDPALFAFGIHGMAATSSPDVEAYVNGLNPAGNGTLLISAGSGFTSCVLP